MLKNPMAELESELRKAIRGTIVVGEPLSRHTSFGIGGPADFWIEPSDLEDLISLMGFLKKERLRWILLGNGTNVLVSDGGFRGVVINLKNLCSLDVRGSSIIAGAGASLQKTLDETVDYALGGFEFAAGIPGSIGGAVITNAGGRDGEIGDVIENAVILNSRMGLKSLPKEELEFSYRNCSLPPEAIVVEVKIGLRNGKKKNIEKKIAEILAYRRLTQPLNLPNAGCIFKNPRGQSAGELIASAGLAGARIGGAEISSQHANFVINRGEARTSDVIALTEMVEKKVFVNSGMRLEREIRVIGE